MPAIECFGEPDLQAFLLGQLPERVAQAVSGHLEACPECEGAARRLDRQTDPVIRALRRVACPAPAGDGTVILAGKTDPTVLEAEATPELLPRRIAGYEVLEEVGRGGMGVVFKARQAHPDRLVALKMILAGAHAGVERQTRFLSEADAIARLQHPHIVQIYEVGQHEGLPFLSLEYVSGGSLAQKLGGLPQPPRQAAVLVETLARTMDHAHQHGVVHRDLKPANILLTPDGTPKVTDFGLAKQERPELTATGAILGTPSYMAPEQAAGDNPAVGPAADIYALGAILYELLTGRPPFRAATALETLAQVGTQEPVSPRQLQPQLPRDLNTICLKCLQKEAHKRYASAQDVAEELRRFLDGKPILARPVGTWERGRRWCRRNPLPASALGVAIAALLAFAVVSSVFALHSSLAAERLRNEQRLTEEALQDVRTQRDLADQRTRLAERRLAETYLDRALAICDTEGDAACGLLWLARALEVTPDHADDLARLIRLNLAGWERTVLSLEGILPHLPLAFSPDGGTALMVGDGVETAQVWNLAANRPLGARIVHRGQIMHAAFSGDGRRLLTGSADCTARLWDAATGQPLGLPLVHASWVRVVAFLPDGKTCLTGSDKLTQFWDMATSRALPTPLPGPALFHALALSPDGKSVAISGYNQVELRDAQTGRPVGATLRGPVPITRLAFSPDGKRLLTGDGLGTAQLWDIATGHPVHQPFRHPLGLTALAFSPDGKTLAIGSMTSRTVRLFDADTGKPLGQPLHPGAVPMNTNFSPDGKTVLVGTSIAGGTRRRVCLWGTAPRDRPLLAISHPGAVRAVAYDPAGRSLLTAGSDLTVRSWDATTGESLGAPMKHSRVVLAVAFSPDGRSLLTACGDSTVRRWETATGKLLGVPVEHKGEVSAAAFRSDGRALLTGGGDGVRLWDLSSEKANTLSFPQPRLVASIAFGPNGKAFLTGSSEGWARLWDAATGQPLTPPVEHEGRVWAVAFSPDGRTFVTGGHDQTAQLWDTATGQARNVSMRHRGWVKAAVFSPDGKMVLTGTMLENVARLWDTATGKPLGPPLPHQESIFGIAFGPDSRTVLTGSEDRTAKLWTVPAPIPGTVERIQCWVRTLTGMELDEYGTAIPLDEPGWRASREHLAELGGPPRP